MKTMTTLIIVCLIVITIWLFILGILIINHEMRIGKIERDLL